MGPRARLDILETEKSHDPAGNWMIPWLSNPRPSHYIHYAILAKYKGK
jgi:hypothetical protein